MTDHLADTKAFKYADSRINDLLLKFRTKGVCGCCTGRAMLFNAATLCEVTMGSADAANLLEEIFTVMRKNDLPAPDYEGEGKVIQDNVH